MITLRWSWGWDGGVLLLLLLVSVLSRLWSWVISWLRSTGLLNTNWSHGSTTSFNTTSVPAHLSDAVLVASDGVEGESDTEGDPVEGTESSTGSAGTVGGLESSAVISAVSEDGKKVGPSGETSEGDEPPEDGEGFTTEAEPFEVELWGELGDEKDTSEEDASVDGSEKSETSSPSDNVSVNLGKGDARADEDDQGQNDLGISDEDKPAWDLWDLIAHSSNA